MNRCQPLPGLSLLLPMFRRIVCKDSPTDAALFERITGTEGDARSQEHRVPTISQHEGNF